MVLIFESTLLLIEVKPPFGGDQHEAQWRAQIKSMIHQRKHGDVTFDVPGEFHFLALGCNVPGYQRAASQLTKEFGDEGLVRVHTHQWADVCHGIHELADGEESRDVMVYADWIEAFTLFGMVEKPLPFADLLKFNDALQPEWRQLLNGFPAPHTQSTQQEIDWSALASFSQGMQLNGRRWK